MIKLEVLLGRLVTSPTLPKSVTTQSRKGTCIAWWWDAELHSWLVVFDDTGELIWVLMAKIKLRANWSAGRRYGQSVSLTAASVRFDDVEVDRGE